MTFGNRKWRSIVRMLTIRRTHLMTMSRVEHRKIVAKLERKWGAPKVAELKRVLDVR